jgi:hypothetical protein
MNAILHIIQNYYGGLIGGTISLGTIIKLIQNWFQKYVIANMLMLQKDTTLTNEQKFSKLTTEIYNGLPLGIKVFIGQNSFANLSQAIYDKMFPPVKTDTNTVVDANAEIKQAIVDVIGEAINNLDKNANQKLEEMTKQIEQEKKDGLNKIADSLKQNLLNNDTSNQNSPDEEQTS